MKRAADVMKNMLSDMPTKLICLAAAVILFFFNRISLMDGKTYTVPLQVDVPVGLAIASAYQKNCQITVRESKTAVNKVRDTDLEAALDLSEIKNPGEYRIPIRVVLKDDAKDIAPLEVTVDPQELTIILEPLMERRVNIIADLRGSPAYGYDLADYSLSPQTIVVRGAKSLVQAANAISTEELDLTGRTELFSVKTKAVLPNPLLRIVGDPVIEFKADIRETVQTKRYDPVEITALDLIQTYEVKSILPVSGRLQVQGPQLAVEAIKPEELRLTVDLSGVRRLGTHVLRVSPEAPVGVSILDYEPKEITVEIEQAGNWRME